MAFYSPYQYQPMVQQPIYTQPAQPAPAQPRIQDYQPDDRVWVQGEVGAKAYLVANGSTVTLWDSESPRIYLKSMVGNVPTTTVLNYTIEQGTPAPVVQTKTDMSQYLTRKEFEEWINGSGKVSEQNG